MLSTAEIFVQYSKWHQEAPPLNYGHLLNAVNNGWSRRNIVDFDANIRHQSNAMSSKIETEISLLRDRTGLEQRYKASHDSIIISATVMLLCHIGLRQQETSPGSLPECP